MAPASLSEYPTEPVIRIEQLPGSVPGAAPPDRENATPKRDEGRQCNPAGSRETV